MHVAARRTHIHISAPSGPEQGLGRGASLIVIGMMNMFAEAEAAHESQTRSEARRLRDSFLGSFGPFVSLFGLFRLFLSVAFPLMDHSGSFPFSIAQYAS
jgi:hypothetical protein